MSDFPKGGDTETTRLWLVDKGFVGLFINWEADAILGKSDEFIKSRFPSTPEGQDLAERLCGLLNTARQTPSSPDLLIPQATAVETFTAVVERLLEAVHATQLNVVDLSDRFNSAVSNLARPRSGTNDSISSLVVERGPNVSKEDDSGHN